MNSRIAHAVRVLVLLLALLSAALPAAAATGRHHVIMIDHSGSMTKFLAADRGLVPFVARLVQQKAVFRDTDTVELLLFSNPRESVPSPGSVFLGSGRDLRSKWSQVAAQLTTVQQWTDLEHGLQEGAARARSRPGRSYLWLLTDNENEKSADANTKQDTLKFIDALKGEKYRDLTHIRIWPVDLQLSGVQQGLMLYGMLVQPGPADEAAARDYDQTVRALKEARLPEFMGQAPFLVRPLGANMLSLEVAGFTPKGGKRRPLSGKGSIVLPAGIFQEGEPITGTLHLVIVSQVENLRLPTARVQPSLAPPRTNDFLPLRSGDMPAVAVPRLDAGGENQLDVEISLPPARADLNWKSVFKPRGRLYTDLALQVALDQPVELDTSRISHAKFHEIAAIVPQLAPQSLQVSLSRPVEIPVDFAGGRFFAVLAGGFIALTVLVLGVGALLGRRLRYRLSVQGEDRGTVALSLFSRHYDVWHGQARLGEFYKPWFRPLRFRPSHTDEEEPVDLSEGAFHTQVDTVSIRLEPFESEDEAGRSDYDE